ncbi:MAG: alpha/beta fold hydrolase [Synechococcus sp.]
MKLLSHRFNRRRFLAFGTAAVATDIIAMNPLARPSSAAESKSFSIESVRYHTVKIDNLDIFYREAGNPENPTILLLHGFPTSSHMFRNLMLSLSDSYHLVAPDYPGYGNSSMPLVDEFDYTFDNLANVMDKFVQTVGLSKYSLYLMDYGAPIGFRLATKHPEKVQALLIQNGNAYEEGLEEFWDPLKAYWADRSEENANQLRPFLEIDGTKWQYLTGVREAAAISPDNWNIDQRFLDRPGNKDIQLALFYS